MSYRLRFVCRMQQFILFVFPLPLDFDFSAMEANCTDSVDIEGIPDEPTPTTSQRFISVNVFDFVSVKTIVMSDQVNH